jgi:hypothetical protein
LFWESWAGTPSDTEIYCRRHRKGQARNDWEDEINVTKNADHDEAPFALEDSNGDIWLFWVSTVAYVGREIHCTRHLQGQSSDVWENETQVTTNSPWPVVDPVALEDRDGGIWLFWRAGYGGLSKVWFKRHYSESEWGRAVELASPPHQPYSKFPLKDSDDDIWVFWRDQGFGSPSRAWFKKLIPAI